MILPESHLISRIGPGFDTWFIDWSRKWANQCGRQSWQIPTSGSLASRKRLLSPATRGVGSDRLVSAIGPKRSWERGRPCTRARARGAYVQCVSPYVWRSRRSSFGPVHLLLPILQNYRIYHTYLNIILSLFVPLVRSLRLTVVLDHQARQPDRSRSRTRPEGGSPSSLALFYFPKPTRFSMSTTRALLPKPAASYAPRVVVVAAVGRFSSLSSCTSRPRHWEVPTRIADGIERRESRRRRRRRRTCGRIGVAPASLRWATMAAYIWIILKRPRVSSPTKWYTRTSWPAHRPRRASGRYVCPSFSLACNSRSRFSRRSSRCHAVFEAFLSCSPSRLSRSFIFLEPFPSSSVSVAFHLFLLVSLTSCTILNDWRAKFVNLLEEDAIVSQRTAGGTFKNVYRVVTVEPSSTLVIAKTRNFPFLLRLAKEVT